MRSPGGEAPQHNRTRCTFFPGSSQTLTTDAGRPVQPGRTRGGSRGGGSGAAPGIPAPGIPGIPAPLGHRPRSGLPRRQLVRLAHSARTDEND